MAQALPELHRRCYRRFGRSGASQHNDSFDAGILINHFLS
jgi:hypothetical protein